MDASSPIKHVRQKNVCEMTEEVIKIAENKKKSIDYLRKRLYYILIELYRSIKIKGCIKD